MIAISQNENFYYQQYYKNHANNMDSTFVSADMQEQQPMSYE
jgi:hypothetical protein